MGSRAETRETVSWYGAGITTMNPLAALVLSCVQQREEKTDQSNSPGSVKTPEADGIRQGRTDRRSSYWVDSRPQAAAQELGQVQVMGVVM